MIIDRDNGAFYPDWKDYCEGMSKAGVRHPLCRRVKVTSDPVGESMTHQSFREETDINLIMQRFQRTGVLPPAMKQAQYADVSGMNDDLVNVINRTSDTLEKAEVFFDGKRKAAEAAKKEADAEAEADRAAGKAARMAKGAASKEKAPQGEAGGGSGGSTS